MLTFNEGQNQDLIRGQTLSHTATLNFCSTSSSTFPKLREKENIGSLAELLLFKIMIHFQVIASKPQRV